MNEGFNLVDDPWIPFPGTDLQSIRSVLLLGHELPGWPSGEPLFPAALLRILTPITYRVCGFDAPNLTAVGHTEQQLKMLSSGRLDAAAVETYLNTWRHRFWLTAPPEGEVPFAQDPEVDLANAAPADKLVINRAAGNNPLWGTQHQGRLAPSEAARHLLIQLYYSAGGTGAARTGPGRSYLKGARLRDTFSVHPIGGTFAETLLLHAVPVAAIPGDLAAGSPFWETASDAMSVLPSGLLEVLAGRFEKAFLLGSENGAICSASITEPAAGIAELAVTVMAIDPFVVYDMTEQPPKPRKPRAGRAVWRELDNIGLRSDLGGHSLAPALNHVETRLADHPPESWTVVTHRGDKSKDIAWDASVLPDVTAMFREAINLECAAAFLDLATQVRSHLGMLIKRLWAETRSDGSAPYRMIDAEFWGRAEPTFWAAITAEQPDSSNDAPWLRDLVGHAMASFDVTVDPLMADPRAQIAIEIHRQRLSTWRPK